MQINDICYRYERNTNLHRLNGQPRTTHFSHYHRHQQPRNAQNIQLPEDKDRLYQFIFGWIVPLLCGLPIRQQVSRWLFRRELNLIEVNNQSEIGTKIFFSKIISPKYGKVKAVKFSNTDPNLFVVACSSNITFYRIDKYS